LVRADYAIAKYLHHEQGLPLPKEGETLASMTIPHQ
jgi:hypothetical protein